MVAAPPAARHLMPCWCEISFAGPTIECGEEFELLWVGGVDAVQCLAAKLHLMTLDGGEEPQRSGGRLPDAGGL